jgi:sulfate adenylyltransferase
VTAKTLTLIPPYGGKLTDLMVPEEAREDMRVHANRLPSLQVSERVVCDLEMLATGAFSPLDRFLAKEDYQRVLDEMRLASGEVFPIPVTLPVEADPAIRLGRDVALQNAKNGLLTVMTVEKSYETNGG